MLSRLRDLFTYYFAQDAGIQCFSALVFVLVASSLANARGGNADRFKVVIFLYMLSTLIAAFVAVCMNFTFRVKVPLTGIENVAEDLTPPGSVFEVLKNLCLSFVANPVNAIANANYIAILFWAAGEIRCQLYNISSIRYNVIIEEVQ